MPAALNVRPLTPELQKTAIEQLNEVPDRIPSDLEALRTWIKQQPHLRARTDDQFLLAFLRGSKHSLEKAKSKIDSYYTLKTKFPELFRVDDVDAILDILRLGVFCHLPKPLNNNGPTIGVMRWGAFPADKYNFGDILRMIQAFTELTLREDDYATVFGAITIIDLENVSMNHVLQMTPALMKKSTIWSEQTIPLRLKANHFINIPGSFETIINMGKPLWSKKQRERLFFHKNMASLHQHFPQQYLPTEYGGENGSLQDALDNWEQRILNSRDYFKDELNYGTDEKLRPGKPINFDNLFGVEGSFRKIEID